MNAPEYAFEERSAAEMPAPAHNTLQSPGWGHGKPPAGLYWTKARIVAALTQYAAENPGALPASDDVWNAIKKGRLDLPTFEAISGQWGGMKRAWLAVGVDRSRITFLNSRWSQAELTYLLDNAGTIRLTTIAQKLGRSYASVKTKLGAKGLGITARRNQGFLSAAEVAKEHDCPYSRVCDLLAAGAIKGRRHPHRQTWLIDPLAITPAVIALLKQPKRTHKTQPTDLGVYRSRYGIRRALVSA